MEQAAHRSTSDEPRTTSDGSARTALLLIAIIAIVRLIYAAVVPLDLVHDEAYYWDWSRNLDYGYFSKPPMIAW